MIETTVPVEKSALPILSLIRSKLGVMTPTEKKIAEAAASRGRKA